MTNENVIIGNTVLYGATSGKLFAAGQAGERFAVRNSGANAAIEGCGANGCEYMTGGTVVILGPVGDNFAAGMTGGMAFVYDTDVSFLKNINSDTVSYNRVQTGHWEKILREIITEHWGETQSKFAERLLVNFGRELKQFWQIVPNEMIDKLEHPLFGVSNEEQRA